jgi:hypothetical protein
MDNRLPNEVWLHMGLKAMPYLAVLSLELRYPDLASFLSRLSLAR